MSIADVPTLSEPPTHAELVTLMRLLTQRRPRGGMITIGSSRDTISRHTAETVAHAWAERDGDVLDIVDWPEEAASWLRQARRFTTPAPDAWVVTGRVAGWLGMGRRLAHSTDWDPARTFATASLADAALTETGGLFDGLCGAASDGGTWTIRDSLLVSHPPGFAEKLR
jgi:hypothetical protein